MEVLEVTGGARLVGSVEVSGAKNSVLKLMAAALLATGRTTVGRVPRILDVAIMAEVLRRLGCEVEHDTADRSDRLRIEVPEKPHTETDYDLVRRMRAAICVLGPLLARRGAAKVALPGGDAIGSRGLDMHVSGLIKLGATVHSEHGFLVATADVLRGAPIKLDFPSVGATENIVMAAVLAKGTTVIDNAAREPEIVDLIRLLSAMGADIDGAGTSTLTVDGVDELHPVAHDTVPDRVVAGTWATAAVMTRGDVTVRHAPPENLTRVLEKLQLTGATVDLELPSGETGFRVRMDSRPTAIEVVTLPYPGFPTDLQPMAISLNSVAVGSSMVTENVFEGRFMFVNELIRLGAEIKVDGHHAAIRGRERLSSAPVAATDIRAGAGLVLAGLVADGVTEVRGVHHIDRGYPDFEHQLSALGATVVRRDAPDPEDYYSA